jgi:copper chaperone CopZ
MRAAITAVANHCHRICVKRVRISETANWQSNGRCNKAADDKADKGEAMKTSVIEVHEMFSVWSVDEVEKQIGEVPGVESVTVDYAAKNATVRYDETQLEVADIKSAVRQHGHKSAAPAAESAGDEHEDHAAPAALPAIPAPASPKPSPAAAAAAPAAGDKPEEATASS